MIDSVTLPDEAAEGGDGALTGAFGAQAVMTKNGRSQVKRRIVGCSQYMCDARILQPLGHDTVRSFEYLGGTELSRLNTKTRSFEDARSL
jgi:hypothetical protein